MDFLESAHFLQMLGLECRLRAVRHTVRIRDGFIVNFQTGKHNLVEVR